MTSYADAAVNSFSDLFFSPKSRHERFELLVSKTSSAATVLGVLIDRRCLLKEFSYKGPCPPLEILHQFMRSQTELRKVGFAGGPQCMICQDEAENDEARAVGAISRNMRLSWIAVLGVILKSGSLTEIECICSRSVQPHRHTEVGKVCIPARMRNISVSVCGWRSV